MLYIIYMTKNNKPLINLLRLEVAKKGQAATYAFFGFSLFSYFYGYGCVRFLLLIKILSAFLTVLTICRYFHYDKICKQNYVSERDWFFTVLLITLNGLGFGIILWLSSYELKLNGIHFVVSTTLTAGLVSSSIVTLSYFPMLFIPFQAFLLLPQIATIIYFYFSPEKLNFLPLIFLYTIYLIYQIKQYSAYHKELVKLFTYQIDLEDKNRELSESKQVIIDQTAKLVHASRLAVVGEMSAGVAHEINNPLTIISSYTQMLIRLSKEGTIDKTAFIKYTEKIYKSADRISTIVKGLKYFGNQTDRRPKKNYTILEIIKETTPYYIEHLKSQEISFKMQDIPDFEIYCHQVQISQVIINLLKNATEALTEVLSLEERWVSMDFKKENNHFYFIVSNGGNKIEKNIADKIFNPFFTTKDNGTGLGLSISHTIMKDHGGELYLDHSYVKTTFIIKHPLGIVE
jgi:signal transduction histidine kinase